MRVGRISAMLVPMALLCTALQAQELVFERLGVPTMETGHGLRFTTQHPDGYYIAWAPHEEPGVLGLFGVRLDNGEYFIIDMSMHGSSHLSPVPGRDGNIYAYVGSPHAHFVRVNPVTHEVTELGIPAPQASYFMAGARGPDGRCWIGSYPRATLVWIDTNTGEFGEVGRLPSDERQKYQFPTLQVSDDNIVYCPVGLHHQELYAYDPAPDTATQILPEEMTSRVGSVTVWRADDGQVYGRSGEDRFRCNPTSIEAVADAPSSLQPVIAGSETISSIGKTGVITFTDIETGAERAFQTQYLGRPVMIYSVCTEWEGKIWGGNGFPAGVFSYDLSTGELVDHGRRSGGSIQVYDIIGTPRGLLLSSYMGAALDLWNPNAVEGEPDNVKIVRGQHQERAIEWVEGPDGNYYIGTVPIKGHVGGGLCRVTLQPDGPEATWWIDPIGAQSVHSCTAIPEINALLCATSCVGGSSSIPTEPEGHVFLWDCTTERVTAIDEPLPGAQTYSVAVRAETGVVYLLARGPAGLRYVAWDPLKRETLHVGELPGGRSPLPYLHKSPVGKRGLIVGLIADAIFAIDPADHSVQVLGRHPSLATAQGYMVDSAGTLYYGSSGVLWRCNLGLE